MCVYEHRAFHKHRDRFERRASEKCKSARIVRIITATFDVNAFPVEVSRVIDEDHRRSFFPVGIAEETNLLATRSDVDRYLGSDLLEIRCDRAHRAIQRNDHDDRNTLPHLDVCEALNCFR